MFSWFLKLLGIDEDRPTASRNSYLDSSAKSATNNTTETTAAKTVEEPESQPEEVPDTPAEVTDTSPAPAPAPEPKPKAAPKSLSDEYPGLKANYVKVLEEAGFTTKASIDKASDKDLLALKGIGKATLKIMRS